MRLEKAFVIGKREYLTRVKTKGFWIATIGLPLFMGAVAVGPTLIMAKTRSEQRIAVVDATGQGLAERLARELSADAAGPEGMARFDVEVVAPAADQAAQRAELDRRVLDEEIDAWVWLSEEGLAGNRVEYHAASLSNFIGQEVLDDRLSDVIGEFRLARAGYDSEQVGELTRSIDLDTVRVSDEGSRAEGGAGALVLGIGMFLILYMVFLVYGSQILQGVLEEKGSRIVEVITSSVTTDELLLGKLGGICLLALTQLAIWMGTTAVLTAPGLLAARFALPPDVELPTLSPEVMLHFFVLFLLGFSLFATFYAMIGASFNSLQEAQQYAGFAMIFIIGPVLFLGPVLNDPDSPLAVVASLIPFFTPLVMVARIAVKMPPLWQLLLAYALTGATVAGMIWLSARIYRVGILMYGKKPTLKEIWRWVRYA